MTKEEAANKLTTHLHACGMLMPIGWVERNGEGSELQEAFSMAVSALLEQSDDGPLSERQCQIVEAMADHNMNAAVVARELNFHRNNVVYHIEQVKKKTGLDPRCFYDLVELLEAIHES